MRRRVAAALALVLALPALALAADKEPKRQLTPADQRKAASVVLKRGDFVAGWKKTPSSPDDDQAYDCPGYDPDGSDLVMTGEAEADFEHAQGFPAVFSFASVYRSKAMALASWTRGVKPAMATCLATILKDALEQEGMTVAITGRGKVAYPKLAPRTAAFRISLRATVTAQSGQRTQVPMTMHIVALGHGRGEAGLMTLAPGKGLAASDLRAFGGLMAKRLAAAKL